MQQEMERVDRAEAFFRSGCSCAQSVLGAYCDLAGMDLKTAMRIAAPFGAGVGRMREICGAVSGMCMVLGLLYGPDDPTDAAQKGAHYALIQQAAERFAQKNGAIVCRTLLGLDKGKDSPTPQKRDATYYQKRPCVQYVRDAAQILADMIAEQTQMQSRKV